MKKLHIPQHGLNIDRSELPQVKSADVPDFLHWLSVHKGIKSTSATMPVASLYPSQGNFNETKIHALMSDKTEHLKKPIIVSGDHFVIDGHHRWLALLNLDANDTIPVHFVYTKALDLIAAMREYPKSFTKTVVESFMSITEAKEEHKVLAFGRMNPPTTGHEKLVNKVHEVAKAHNASHEVILSHTQDDKKNPLSQEQKIKHAKRFFPGTNVTGASKESPTLFHHAAKAYEAGVKHLHVVMGSDRAKEFHDALKKHNGKFDKDGHGYKFKSITVHSAGERDPDAEGTEGMSASKMREHAAKGNYAEFKKGIPGHVTHTHAMELYHDVRKSMGHTINEEVLLTEGVHDAGIFKAVFLAGGPGSGKDFVLKKALDGHGLVELNSDKALEMLMDRNKLSKKMPEHEQEKRDVVRARAKSITDLRQKLALHGRNGLIVNSTGASPKKIGKLKELLNDMGYDTKMVFVDTSDDVSRQRNVERGQRGGRQVPEQLRASKWKEAQDARVEFSKLFGTEHYHEFKNDEDLRANLDPELHKQKGKELLDLFKTVKKFAQTPPEHPEAQKWIHTNLGKLAKTPVGNKKQQKKVAPPHMNSAAWQEAQGMGLSYYGFGRYGKNGRITHFSVHDKLVEKQKALTPPKSLEQPKKLDESFVAFMEEDNEPIRYEAGVAVPGMQSVGTDEVHSLLESPQSVESAFETVCEDLVTETEATRDTGEEGGPILGMQTGAGETIETPSGKATAGPTKKKTFQSFRKDK